MYSKISIPTEGHVHHSPEDLAVLLRELGENRARKIKSRTLLEAFELLHRNMEWYDDIVNAHFRACITERGITEIWLIDAPTDSEIGPIRLEDLGYPRPCLVWPIERGVKEPAEPP